MRRLLGVLASLLLSALLTACGGGGGGDSTSNPGGGSGGSQGGGGGSSPPPPPANRAPTVQVSSFTTNEDTALTARITATDLDGDVLTFTRTSDPTRGVVASFSSTTGDFTYQPTANANGADTFAITVADTAGHTVNATIAIAIQPVNDVPVAADAELKTTDDTTVLGRVTASDVDATPLTFTPVQLPAHGTLAVTAADGSFSYRPDGIFVGEDTFTIRASDSEGAAAVANVRVVVTSSALNYTGSISQAVITEASAPHVAKALWSQLTQLIAASEESAQVSLGTLPAQIDTTLNGAVSGTARLIGAIDASGTGSVQIQYSGFVQAASSLSGLQIVQFTGNAASPRYLFKNTALRLGDVTAVASGSLAVEPATPAPGRRITGDMKIAVAGQVYWLRDIDLVRREAIVASTAGGAINTIAWTGSATLFDPARGYVALGFDEPLNFFSTADTVLSRLDRPIGRGGPTAVGASQAKLWISVPGPDYVAVELDLDARGRPSKALAFRLDEKFDLPAGHDASHAVQAAVTYPIDAVFAEIGRPFHPEGRFSEQRDGHFLSHHWFIDSAPAGSAAELVDADTPRPSLTADAIGDYILRLEVFDGSVRSTDYLLVGSGVPGASSGTYSAPPSGRFVTGAADLQNPGSEVTLDARKSSEWNSTESLPGYVWSVRAPDNSYPVLGATGPVMRFIPTQPGKYEALFHRPDYMPHTLFTKQINVRPTLRFAPAASLKPDITGSKPFARDIDGDGLIDIVSPLHDYGALTIFRRLPNGRFAAGVRVEDPAATGRFYLEDVTGDGRLDLIRQVANTFSVSVQTPAGSFAAPVTLNDGPRACVSFPTVAFQGTVDVDRDGRPDIIRSVSCNDSSRWMLVNRSPGGTFIAGEELAVSPSEWLTAGAAGDIDGDGDRDLVGLPYFTSTSSPSFLNVLRLDAGGAFVPSTIPLADPITPGVLQLRDLNGDNRLDIVGLRDPILVLIQNPDGTFTERGRVAGRTEFANERPEKYFADVTNDGRVDIVLPSGPGMGPRLIEQLPNGSFVERVPYDGPDGALLDVNLDGRVDVVGANNSVSIQGPP